MRQRLKRGWQSLKIRDKIKLFTRIVFISIFLSTFLAVWEAKYFLVDFSLILNSNSLISDFVQCMEKESDLFEEYIKMGKETTYKELEKAIKDTRQIVMQLPFDYEKIGEERYAKTWSVLNMYQVYCEKRNGVLSMGKKSQEYIADLYEVYDIQKYLQSYAKQLMRDTLEHGVRVYGKKVRMMIVIPVMLILFEILFFLCTRRLSDLMNSSIVSPVVELAQASRRIAENDFFIEDIKPRSEDELGELVTAFNKMKYATGEYIMALEERRKALDLYHGEELEKIKIAARLDAMELDLLKSQINPHFLFNTLNVISGMANLEEAQTTEAMIQSLSFLFRYNLKTPEEKVSLARELKVVRDYMFLQEMRFGGRITYDIDCQTQAEFVLIPTFTFQPLVENSIIHGLGPKEAGGHILIRVREIRGKICMIVADNGVGMSKENLRKLRRELKEEEPDRLSRPNIGLFNIYRRIHTMYKDGNMQIYSKPEIGTIIRIYILDEREGSFEKGEMPDFDCG